MKRTHGSKKSKLFRLAVSALFVIFAGFAPVLITPDAADAARAAVTVEKLTANGGFIVEPELVTLEENDSAAGMTTRFLTSKFPGVTAYKSSESGSDFYLKGVYDPSRGGLLSEFTLGNKSGWMITVNNSFIRTSAGAHILSDGDVVRWQYTLQLGADLGEDVDYLGTNTKANKDSLLWKVAEVNAAGNKYAYGSAYTEAMTVLKDLNASQASVNSALDALNSVNVPATTPDSATEIVDPLAAAETGGSGGGCDSGMGILVLPALSVLGFAALRKRRPNGAHSDRQIP